MGSSCPHPWPELQPCSFEFSIQLNNGVCRGRRSAHSSSLTAHRSLALHDKFGRAITDLRISITDRCNYKCVYCRTGNEGALYGDLPFDDYLRMARVLVGMGINKVRLTGGEPLLRKGVVDFVRELAKLKPQATGSSSDSRFVPGHRFSDAANAADHAPALAAAADRARPFANTDPLDIALTTNGHLLADLAQPLKDAGLTRVTVSHGRGRSRPLHPHHPRARRIRPRARRHSRRPPRRTLAAQSELRPHARLQRRSDHSLRHVRARRGRDRALHRIHAARRGPHLVALDRRHARRNSHPHGRVPAAGRDSARALARPRGATASKTASAKSASSRRSRIPSADTAAASASPATERFAPASSPCGTTTCTRRCGAAPPTKSWQSSSAASSRRKKNVTTSAKQISSPPQEPWSTSAANSPHALSS